MIRLPIIQILKLYKKMIDLTGGENGLRSISMLESSLENLCNYGFSEKFRDLVFANFPNSGNYMGGKQNIGL